VAAFRIVDRYLRTMRPEQLLAPTPAGLFCPPGGFYIDPTRPVERALITHAHSDHARAGHAALAATAATLDLMGLRYGEDFAGTTQPVGYGERIRINGVGVTFWPAGHILGSAQILLEAGGLRLLVTGDYKTVADPTCAPFERLACDVLISEATFALPVFSHGEGPLEIGKLLRSLALFPDRTHLLGVYALGKAQRVIAMLRLAGYDSPIYLHGALEAFTQYYASHGLDLGPVTPVREATRAALAGAIVLCPPVALHDVWARRFGEPVRSLASGWMRLRARARQRGVELPLVISDHADWEELTATVTGSGAREIWVTHGREEALVHWSVTQGLKARALNVAGYGEEDEDAA
jgi:putative mRNA 3-end processing factor